MFIFLTMTLFFQFKYGLFTSREMRVILNERALEPAFLAAGQCTCALVFQPCLSDLRTSNQSRSQRLRFFWSAPTWTRGRRWPKRARALGTRLTSNWSPVRATRYPPRIHSYHELSKSIEFTKIMNLSTVVITAGLVDQRLLVLVHPLQSTPMGNSR